MATVEQAVRAFLAHQRIAVAGVSLSGQSVGNVIARKLVKAGYTVYGINPRGGEVDDLTLYPDLGSVRGPVDGLIIATRPREAVGLVRACIALGIGQVWFHRSFGQGSVSDEAVQMALDAGMTVVPAGCPMMYVHPVDPAHRCLKWALRTSQQELPAVPA